MKARHTNPWDFPGRNGPKPPTPRRAKRPASEREEMINALRTAAHGMVALSGLIAYEAATEKSRHPKNHFKINFSHELNMIVRALKKAGA
jgi:hypothetical protein